MSRFLNVFINTLVVSSALINSSQSMESKRVVDRPIEKLLLEMSETETPYSVYPEILGIQEEMEENIHCDPSMNILPNWIILDPLADHGNDYIPLADSRKRQAVKDLYSGPVLKKTKQELMPLLVDLPEFQMEKEWETQKDGILECVKKQARIYSHRMDDNFYYDFENVKANLFGKDMVLPNYKDALNGLIKLLGYKSISTEQIGRIEQNIQLIIKLGLNKDGKKVEANYPYCYQLAKSPYLAEGRKMQSLYNLACMDTHQKFHPSGARYKLARQRLSSIEAWAAPLKNQDKAIEKLYRDSSYYLSVFDHSGRGIEAPDYLAFRQRAYDLLESKLCTVEQIKLLVQRLFIIIEQSRKNVNEDQRIIDLDREKGPAFFDFVVKTDIFNVEHKLWALYSLAMMALQENNALASQEKTAIDNLKYIINCQGVTVKLKAKCHYQIGKTALKKGMLADQNQSFMTKQQHLQSALDSFKNSSNCGDMEFYVKAKIKESQVLFLRYAKMEAFFILKVLSERTDLSDDMKAKVLLEMGKQCIRLDDGAVCFRRVLALPAAQDKFKQKARDGMTNLMRNTIASLGIAQVSNS